MQEITQVIKQSEVEESTAKSLEENFIPFFQQAKEWSEKAKELIVTDVSQKEEMKMAREARLALKEIRINADKKRKELKQDSIRYGRAVQGVYNVIEYLVVPIEKHLLDQEKFAEKQEAERIAALKAERENELEPFSEFVPFGVDLGGMSDDDYAKLFNGCRLQYRAKIEAEQKAEAERIAKEKADAEEAERIAKENERLRIEAEKREKEIQQERQRIEAERKLAEGKAAKEREIQEQKLKAEREEKERLEAEIKAKEEAEEKTRIEKEEAKRKAAAAPDKEKLLSFAKQLADIDISGAFLTDKGRDIYVKADNMLIDVVKFIREKANKL